MTSLSQQKKIEELEAQLQEAEDIVKDLRQELREVQAELERVKSNNKQNLDERYIAENRLCTSQPTAFPPPEPQHESVKVSAANIFNSNNGLKCYSQLINMGRSYVSNPDLPSIILRTKEPELYRNGCTQRIRACERSTMDRELSPSRDLNDVKHETSVNKGGDVEKICTVPTHENDNVCNIEKKEGVQEESRFSSWYQVRNTKSFRRKRKRATRFGKKRAPSSAKHTTKSEEDPSQMDPKLSSDTTKTGSHLGYAEAMEGGVELVNEFDVQNIIQNGKACEENGSIENSGVPACKMDLKFDVPLVNSELKVSDTANGMPSQTVNDRVIKYTFQRKRKRERLSSSDGGALVEKSNLTRNTGEKQNGSLESQKSTSIVESSRDSRRLAQVARQVGVHI